MPAPAHRVPPPGRREELPAGYSIADPAPASSAGHRLLHGRGRDQQLIGVRNNREEAIRLAYAHHGRAEAERSTLLTRSTLPTHGPRR